MIYVFMSLQSVPYMECTIQGDTPSWKAQGTPSQYVASALMQATCLMGATHAQPALSETTVLFVMLFC